MFSGGFIPAGFAFFYLILVRRHRAAVHLHQTSLIRILHIRATFQLQLLKLVHKNQVEEVCFRDEGNIPQRIVLEHRQIISLRKKNMKIRSVKNI